MSPLTLEHFSPYVGETFSLALDGGSLAIELIEASPLQRKDDGTVTQFSVLWRGPEDALLEQGIYAVSHPEAGRHELFLVTVGPGGGGMQYEAVFA